ncbi:hypothetical protein U1Q18_049365, partial [Sarracenia purpurea var. burkii]
VKQSVVNGGEHYQERQVFDKKFEGGEMVLTPSYGKDFDVNEGSVEEDIESGEVETDYEDESVT